MHTESYSTLQAAAYYRLQHTAGISILQDPAYYSHQHFEGSSIMKAHSADSNIQYVIQASAFCRL